MTSTTMITTLIKLWQDTVKTYSTVPCYWPWHDTSYIHFKGASVTSFPVGVISLQQNVTSNWQNLVSPANGIQYKTQLFSPSSHGNTADKLEHTVYIGLSWCSFKFRKWQYESGKTATSYTYRLQTENTRYDNIKLQNVLNTSEIWEGEVSRCQFSPFSVTKNDIM